MFGFNKKEVQLFKRLNCPKKIQDFLNKIPINHEKEGDTVLSPRMVLKKKLAHCMEGAMFAATALRFHGHLPLVVDLTANQNDDDHVITVFKRHGYWGAISKTNHATLRYREPVYRSIRELSMSYFHEYYDDDCKKTLRSYTLPVNLAKFDRQGWMTATNNLHYIPKYLAKIPHKLILTRSQIAFLRKADEIERQASSVQEWPKD